MSSSSDTPEKSFRQKLYDFTKKVYWYLSLAIVVGICYYLYNVAQRPVASILFFIAGFMLVYFYWIKWFKLPEVNPSWPPTLGICPDYLSLVYVPNTSNIPGAPTTVPKCFDYVGVSSNGVLEKSQAGQTLESRSFDPNPVNYPGNTNAQRMQSFCNAVRNAGLTFLGQCPEE